MPKVSSLNFGLPIKDEWPCGDVTVHARPTRPARLALGGKLLDQATEVCIHGMKLKTLPTETEMLELKQELNFLLWTRNDVPEVPTGFIGLVKSPEPPEKIKINLHCTAHTTVTVGILTRRGFGVTTCAGMAFLLDPSPGRNPQDDYLHQIARHWWLSIEDHGLVDLSLSAESENPLVYRNRSAGERWKVVCGDDQQKLTSFLDARQRGCFYLTTNKKRVSQTDLDQSLAQLFAPAKMQGFAVPYAKLVDHCEKLLCRATESLTSLPQIAAWHTLSG